MKEVKKVLLITLTFVSLINFVSAQFYGGYGRFSIRNFFTTIDPQTVTLITFFIIFFALLYYGLAKVFKDPYGQPNKAIAGTISLAVSFLMVYGIYRQGFDISSWFFRIGVPTDIFYTIMPVLLLIFVIFLIWKTSFGVFLMVFGAIIVSITVFTDIIYEKGVALVIGIILILVGLFVRSRRARKYAAVGGKYTGKGIGWGAKKGWRGAKKYGYKGAEGALKGMNLDTREDIARWKAEEKHKKESHEEALNVNRQINEVKRQIKDVEKNMRKYKRAAKKATSPQEASTLQNAVINLENHRRELENRWRQLANS